MEYRIEISPLPEWRDARGEGIKCQINNFPELNADKVVTRDVYAVSADITEDDVTKATMAITNPVLQKGTVGETVFSKQNVCDWLVAVGFRPGVTDNVGKTAKEAISDIVGRKLRDDEYVFSSVEYMIHGDGLDRKKVEHIAKDLLANELIETISIFSAEQLLNERIPLNLPLVKGTAIPEVKQINLEVSDDELLKISREGILALSLDEMKSIQNYFRKAEGREKSGLKKQPTDVELEVLAQTWSEHCKHKIFSANIEYEDENGKKEYIKSCYKSYVQKSTKEIGGEIDWLVSVFHDNAGVIKFNDKLDLVYKVETHNSPSALDPYGGAMTGIVGVNRDPMGTGQGANLLINVWGYCLGSPYADEKEVPEGLFHPRRLRDNIHKGIIDGGNQSGIPYGLGWEFFEERYLGKPLVYCGTLGTLPKKIGTVKGHEKSINPGDLIVMAGGRIGKDGIHGATFSSEELHKDSPNQAVQIGDPITQKKMSDFIYEARDRNLYRFVTDNGAGGLSSSIGEMCEGCGGCVMDLKKAPLKYAGLAPWEILVSEAQERMSFAVPPENIEEFKQLAASREVEVTVMGEFNNSGKFHMLYGDRTVAFLDVKFMHDGAPEMNLKAKWTPPSFPTPKIQNRETAKDITELVGRLNICSNEYKARQYDHEVKGLSIIKPFTGKYRDIAGDATVFTAEPGGREGIILSCGILPRYSDIDTYHMTASVIDLSIRRVIAVGGKPDHIAGLDNFCWPDPVKSDKTPDGEYKLAQLVRANKALYDYTKAFRCPCISGKDSMKNDSSKGGKKISIPPTLLFSAVSRMEDISKAVTPDVKKEGDLIYIVGYTKNELGGSEYLAMLGIKGGNVPKVNAEYARKIYKAISEITENELAASLTTPAAGGLAVSLFKKAAAGRMGLQINMDMIPSPDKLSLEEKLFSETNTRFVFSTSPVNKNKIEKVLKDLPFARIGVVISEQKLILKDRENGNEMNISLKTLLESYKGTLADV